MLRQVDYVLTKLDWMRTERIWPNGLRYLWTDAFGLVLYVSLYRELGEERWLDEAERLVTDVKRVLGRPRGLRIGEAPSSRVGSARESAGNATPVIFTPERGSCRAPARKAVRMSHKPQYGTVGSNERRRTGAVRSHSG
jgi:hypothetical protein